MSTRKIPQLTI